LNVRAWALGRINVPDACASPRLPVESRRHQGGDQAQADSQYRQDGCPNDSERFHCDLPLQDVAEPTTGQSRYVIFSLSRWEREGIKET
jgi:hypothetical protein